MVRSVDVRRWTDRRLVGEAQSLYRLIFIVDCFATCDICLYENLCAELTSRGFEVATTAEIRKRIQP